MADRPNILILMTDQQRADCLSCAGHPQLATPNMDRLAAEGVRFPRAVTNSPLCMPARASFISGLCVHNHNLWANAGELAAGDDSLFQRLRAAGYTTAHIGKSHYYEHRPMHLRDREDYMHARGFDYVHETTGPWATCACDSYLTDYWRDKGMLEAFRDDYAARREHRRDLGGGKDVWASPLPAADHMDSYVGRAACDYIGRYGGESPFALFVGFGGPHEPWDAPGEYALMFDPADAPPPIAPAEPGDWVPEAAAEWQRHGRVETMTELDVRRLRANYYGKIALIDHWVGEVLAACERARVLDDLLVVFWSDHGEMAGDHQLLYKSRFFESALRIPLIVRWPGHAAEGRTTDTLAQTVDILPTVLEAAGLDVPERCPGVSLWLAASDPSIRVRDAAFSEVSSGGRRILMACTERHKYAVFDDGEGSLLYDLAEDPHEQRNLIGHPDAAAAEAEMRDRLLRFLCETQYVMRM